MYFAAVISINLILFFAINSSCKPTAFRMQIGSGNFISENGYTNSGNSEGVSSSGAGIFMAINDGGASSRTWLYTNNLLSDLNGSGNVLPPLFPRLLSSTNKFASSLTNIFNPSNSEPVPHQFIYNGPVTTESPNQPLKFRLNITDRLFNGRPTSRILSHINRNINAKPKDEIEVFTPKDNELSSMGANQDYIMVINNSKN